MPAPTALPTTDAIAQAVQRQFADRPTLRTVTAQLLADNLKDKYPPLSLAVGDLRLALPRHGGGRRLLPLLDVALNHLADGSLPDPSRRAGVDSYLSDATGMRLTFQVNGQRDYDLDVILAVIRELPLLIVIAFQEALTRYWGQDSDVGGSRWQWLGDILRTTLRTAALRQADLPAEQRRMLDAVLDHPDLEARNQQMAADHVIHAYTLETTLTQADRRVTIQASDILLVNAKTVLLCSPAGAIEAFASLDAFGQAWGQRFAQRYRCDAITWNRFEPAGNLFDVQAALLLTQQLDDLAAMPAAGPMPREALLRHYQALTDPVTQLSGAPTHLHPLLSALPDWLKQANASQRFGYFQHLAQLAAVKQRTEGRQFLEGLKDLRTFAADALYEQMQTHADATGYRADDLELSFAVAVGDAGSGYIEPVNMSLTELAVRNLSGKPKGRLSVRHRQHLPVPAWMDQAYIEGLVTQVDVGARYPQWLNTQLLADTPQAQQRQALFGAQMQVHWPLLALTLWTRGEAGFTRQGYRYVAALMRPTKAGRTVDEQEIVIRPLAFLRQPGATPDVVADMYLIEPRDTAMGPHILYRGQYAESLREFPSRAALLAAIAAPGPLHDSVLTWLPNGARAVYDHGGFQEPHLARFIGVGAEFDPLSKPAPALLGKDDASGELLTALETGQLMSYLYASHARTLVQISEQTSTSNAESRWAVVLEGSWLLFNTLLLPLLRGPAMLAGWMLQIAPSLLSDIPNLASVDPIAKETAWIDLLLNLGLVLLHGGLPVTPLPPQPHPDAVTLQPWLRQRPAPLTAPTSIRPGIVGLPAEPPGLGRLLIDFNRSSARSASTDRLFQQMLAIRVAWPDVVPAPLSIGPFQGLYRIDGQWRAAVRGRLFPVNIVPGFGEVYAISAAHPQLPGFKLKTDGRGHWALDEGLRLKGGGPKNRIAEARKRNRERLAQLRPAYELFTIAQKRVEAQVKQLLLDVHTAEANTTLSVAEKTKVREAFLAALTQQTADYVNMLEEAKELAALQTSPPPTSQLRSLLNQIILNTRQAIVVSELFRQELDAAHREFTISADSRVAAFRTQGQQGIDRYMEYLKRTADMNETQAKGFDVVDRHLAELAQVPGSEALYRSLTQDRPNEVTAVRLKGYQLVVLKTLCNPLRVPELQDALNDTMGPVILLARSHEELRNQEAYSHEERVAVLENLVQQYGRCTDSLEALGVFNQSDLDTRQLARLMETLQELSRDAESKLVAELKKAPPSAPATVPPRTGNRRVIKTVSGSMVGRVRARVPNQGGEIVDVIAPFDDETLASYHEHAPGTWVKIQPPPVPVPPRIPHALAILKNQGKKLLEQMANNIQRLEGYAQRAFTPKEIHEQLQREAAKFEQLVRDLEAGFTSTGASKTHADTRLIRDLSEGAATLNKKGADLRTQMALARPPIAEDVEFLLETGDLQVLLTSGRTQLKTGLKDFMQEYVLATRRSRPLWFAHFHYPTRDTPKASYTVAHLKTQAQRFETYASLLAKEKDALKVIEIHRALITPALAAQRFLPLSP